MKKLLLYSLFIFSWFGMRGQGSITTDRPDQTENAQLIAPKAFQIEMGLININSKDNSDKNRDYQLPNIALRYNAFKKLELRFNTALGNVNIEDTGIQYLDFGAKIALFNLPEKNIYSSLILHNFVYQHDGNNLKNEDFHLIPKIAISHSLSSKIGIGYNLGLEYFENKINSYLFTASISSSLSDKIGFFLEPYCFLKNGSANEINFNGGLTYLISDDLQLDTSYGIGLNNQMNFLSAGISIRI